MITVREALQHILNTVPLLGLEKTAITDARDRVLGEDVRAPRDIPPRTNSAMDGYALRAEDITGASAANPKALTVTEDIPAGHPSDKAVGPGEAARIMTGAALPEGADTMVKVEDTESDGSVVRIFAEAPLGEHVRYRGEDVKAGEIVVPRGTLIRPAEIGMMASVGRSSVYVYRKPVVAILATGDEIVDLDEDPEQGKIISSNTYSLYSQVVECGGIPRNAGIAKDTRDDLLAHFRAALGADIILSSGGVSVGDYDFVKDVMKEVGTGIEFWQVAQRPGKPLAFGKMGNTLVFGLPGNPVSSMITFEQYVRPAILKMTGHRNIFRRTVTAVLTEDVEKKKGLRYFFRARVTYADGEYRAATTGEQGSGILKSMVLANGIMVIPEEVTALKAGDRVIVQLLDNSLFCDAEPSYL
ncbi:MAG: molybdopterin molybdotransferase MoeA [Deltaproteobacteria bacterium]|nr:molybdopterin molybdotransferase MoeA [Deltaproteobacteria bacterium]